MCHNQDDYRPKPHITKDTETVSYICTGVVWNMAHLHAANGASCRRDLNWSGSFCRYKIRRLYQSVRPSSSFILHSKQRASKFMSFHDMTWHDMILYYWIEDASSWCFAFCCKNIRKFRRAKQSKRRGKHYNYFYLSFYVTKITYN